MNKNKKDITSYPHNFSWFNFLRFFMIFTLLISFMCFVLCCIPATLYNVAENSLQKIHFEKLECAIENLEFEDFPIGIKNYADVIISVTISISVALISITATIFIFSKSALDRINDENEYVSDIVNVHKRSNIQQLLWICIVTVGLIITTLLWHLLFSFANQQVHSFRFVGLISLAISSILYFVFSCVFWNRCICVEESLQRIIVDECGLLKERLNEVLPPASSENRFSAIGDWITWEDDAEKGTEGHNLCQNMTPDQFINLFQKTQSLLLSGDSHSSVSSMSSSIITILQERMDILGPNTKVEEIDLKNRVYIGSERKVFDAIEDFEKNVGFSESESKDFFSNTKTLYEHLKKYRNLLISERYTRNKVDIQSKEKIEKHENYPENNSSLVLFSQALYYFFLRVLSVFVCSVRITGFSLNGCSLNYANFYGSTLEDITLYSSFLFRTVLSRAVLNQVILDISKLYEVDFYNTGIANSSLNNCTLENVTFERSTVQKAGFDSCQFNSCVFKDNDITDCIFNNSELISTNITSSNFSFGKFKNITWEDCTIVDCLFQDADVQKWTGYTGFSLINCDFSRSVWRDIDINSWVITGSVFTDADLSSILLYDVDMSSSSFLRCSFAGAKLRKCAMQRSSLQYASLFEAVLNDVDLLTADLSNVIAVKAKFERCNLSNTNCAEADFSDAEFISVIFTAARLYDSAMMSAKIKKCIFKYILADHLQFTFSLCEESNFSYSSLAESNMTKTSFKSCDFTGSDLSGLNSTETEFIDCKIVGVDFSSTRFVDAHLVGTNKCMVLRNCDFSACKFENVLFKNIQFVDCVLDDTTFVNCILEEVKATPLTRYNFKKLSNKSNNSIRWMVR